METLVKIQSGIRMIEELTISDPKYYSEFNYKDERTLEIKCYCTGHAVKWYTILERTENAIVDIENNKIKIYSYKH